MSRGLRGSAGVLLAFLAGLAVMGFGAWKVKAGWEAQSWPVTPGVVQHSSVEKHPRPGRRRGHNYRPRVEYAYSVGGRYYHASRISFGDAAIGFGAAARWIADRYPVASEVVVHYDPEDPRRAVLVTGVTLGTGGIVAVGLCVCVGSLLAGPASRRLRRRS